jgi:glycine betaine/proline transport system ATP-binding protein
MKPVRTVAYLKDGPRTALHKLERAGLSGIFVVTRDGHFRGHIDADTLQEAAQRGNHDTVETILDPYEEMKTDTETPIREIFEVMHENRSPLPVVDDEEKLKGVIVRGAVIGGLATRGSMEEGAAE